MKKTQKIILILLLVFIKFTAPAQNILAYYKGNKDSLTKDALALIQKPEPTFSGTNQAVSQEYLADLGLEQPNKYKNHYFTVRDKKKIFAYYFPSKSANTIILLHGVGSSGYIFNKTAGYLQRATNANVYAVDLRGHGKSEGPAGDVDYINQYADDLVDIIASVRKSKPQGKIIIAAHSMGGGITFNYLISHSEQKIDGLIMFAPLLSQLSPAIKQPEKTEGDISEPALKIHIERIIGLKMLNEIQNTTYNYLPVLFFNKPTTDPLQKYTFRANQSMSPEKHEDGLKAVKVPFLVIVGTKDEVFDANMMKKVVEENSKGKVEIIEGATHNGVRHSEKAYKFIKNWFLDIK